MALTANPHPDGTVDPLDGVGAGSIPLARFEGEAILGEQSASPILLNFPPVGDDGRNARSGSGALRGLFDGRRRGGGWVHWAIHRLEARKRKTERKRETYGAGLLDSLEIGSEIEDWLEPFFKADFIRLIIFETPSLSSGWPDIFNSSVPIEWA